MGPESVKSFYEHLDFEVLEIDQVDTLYLELLDDGTYATVSNDDGHMPESLNSAIVFSVYDDNDSFQWSVTLEDSYYLQELLSKTESMEGLLSTLQDIRQEPIEHYASLGE